MVKGNKGEWSELYVLFHVLAHGKLYAADSSLNVIDEKKYIPVSGVVRPRKNSGDVFYDIGTDIEICDSAKNVRMKIEKAEFADQSVILLDTIKAAKGSSFEAPEAEKFMSRLFIESIKAPSTSKSDISLLVEDVSYGIRSVCGWSIKSELGHPPTLLNATGATRIVYNVIGLDRNAVEEINSIDTDSKVRDKVQAISKAGKLDFSRIENDCFRHNLRMVDCLFPDILALALQTSYEEEMTSCREVIDLLEERDPLSIGKGLYTYKFKQFLLVVALGMTPGKEWDGYNVASGGYIVVKADGTIVAFGVHNRNEFEDYLLDTTRFESASTGRHKFGFIYEEDGKLKFDLTLQIRFIR